MQKLLNRKTIQYTSSAATAASLVFLPAYFLYAPPQNPTPSTAAPKMGSLAPNAHIPQVSRPYTATFSVPMHCESCTKSIRSALSSLPSINNISFSLPQKLVTISSTAPPSSIISAIQSTGRTAILRGSGQPNTAAVCILETPVPASPPRESQPSPVRGLARLIELDERITMLDLTLTGMKEGLYTATIRSSGDISRGKEGVGDVWKGFDEGGGKGQEREGVLGKVMVNGDGRGGYVAEVGWRVWEMIGRGVLVERDGGAEGSGASEQAGADEVVLGVVARSAGLWENEKVVCGCSGKTVWDERKEMVERGMV